jgi:digeranylgeranylglycerophospholipid reductase
VIYSSENVFDVIIVGAGPAGLSAAYSIAKNNLKVLTVEKSSGIGNIIRTSGASFIKDMKENSIPENLYHPVRVYKLYSPNHSITSVTRSPEACVLDVRGLYRFLGKKAAKAGASIILNTNVKGVIREGGDIVGVKANVTGQKHEFNIFSKILIDASGFSCVIGKQVGLVEGWSRFGVGVEFEAYSRGFKADEASLMVGHKFVPGGYAWVFPVDEELLRIGVGINRPLNKENPTHYLRNLINKRLGPLKKVGKIVPIEFHSGIVPNELPSKTVKDNIMLVGDSAGQVNPLVLEGIRYAMKFGSLAGDIASESIKNGLISEEYLKSYEKTWRKRVEKNFTIAHLLQSEWIKYSDEEWDKEIQTLENISGYDFIDFLKSNFSLKNLIKMSIKYPALRKNRTVKKVIKSLRP